MKHILLGLPIVAILVLSGCVEKNPLPALIGKDVVEIDTSAWEQYGAVYLYDELRLTMDFSLGNGGFSTIYTVNQAIRILDKSGVKHGTLKAPKFDGELTQFDIRHVDAKGRNLPLDIETIREQFLDTGKIVFPRVQPGSELFVNMSFHSQDPVSYIDHVYTRELPVAKGRFSFLHSNSFNYKTKSYHIDAQPKEVSDHFRNGIMIDLKGIEPFVDLHEKPHEFLADRLDFTDLVRTHIELEHFWSTRSTYTAPNWKKLAEEFIDRFHSTSFFSTSSELKKTTEWLVRHDSSDFDKADTVLQYVQDNFSIVHNGKASTVNLGNVLKAKSGNTIEISVLLSEMFKILGLETRTYVTRSSTAGGFDPELPSWSQLHTPIISVVIEGNEMIAFPFLQWYRLGECPPEIDGSFALDLQNGKTVKLPQSIHNRGLLRSTVEISLDDPNKEKHIWRYRLADHFGARLRAGLKRASQYDLIRLGKNILHKYSDRHKLERIQKDRINRNLDLNMDITFTNETLAVEHQEGNVMLLKPFFRRYFTRMAETKAEQFSNDLEIVFEEEVYLMDFTSNKARLTYTCEPLDNVLFKNECVKEEYAHDAIVSRTLTVKKTQLSRDELKQILPDIRKLNSIGESYVTYSN